MCKDKYVRVLFESRADRDNFFNWLASHNDEMGPYTTPLELLRKFEDIRNKKRVTGELSDYYYWIKNDSIIEFMDFIDKFDKEVTRKYREEELRAGAHIAGENEDWRVYSINSHAAAMKYGKGTKWCITGESGLVWNKYKEDGAYFYFFIRKKPRGNPTDKIAVVAFHDGIVEIYNSIDEEISDVGIENPPEYPDLGVSLGPVIDKDEEYPYELDDSD